MMPIRDAKSVDDTIPAPTITSPHEGAGAADEPVTEMLVPIRDPRKLTKR
jgi:hypothetical protein